MTITRTKKRNPGRGRLPRNALSDTKRPQLRAAVPAYMELALGTLPASQKAAFIRDALQILEHHQIDHGSRRPVLPKSDRIALTRIGRQTARLIEALNKAQETETATMLLRDAWLKLDHLEDETLGNPMPTLLRLQQAIERCLPEKKSALNPAGRSTPATLAIIALADRFVEHFGKPPGFSRTSPFVTFIRESLPAYGLPVPPVATLRELATRA